MKLTAVQEQVVSLLNAEGIMIGDDERAIACLSECVGKNRVLHAYEELREAVVKKYYTVPLCINGIKIYVVEGADGHRIKHCSTREDAEKICGELNAFR